MIVLASQSPRRKKLLQQLNLDFRVEPSSADEFYSGNENPSEIVQKLALRKAIDISRSKKEALVIGADTLVIYENTILGKPNTAEEARKMLSNLSGNCHSVFTGVALVKTDVQGNILQKKTFVEKTKVYFGNLSRDEIDNYVNSGSPMDKAGSYGIQDDWGAIFVKRIEGDYYNVVGLPLHALYQHLKSFAPEALVQSLNTKKHGK